MPLSFTWTTRVDGVNYPVVADVNLTAEAVVAIIAALGGTPQGTAADLETRLSKALSGTGYLDLATSTELTIATGSVTPTQNWHTIDTQSDAATDDLDTIVASSVTDGFILLFRASHTSRDVVVKHNTGNIVTTTGLDITLDEIYQLCFAIYDASLTKWIVGMIGGGAASSSSDPIGNKRLSLESGVRVSTTDQTAKTNVYWTDGTTNLSVAVPATTNTPFDVFYSLSGDTLSTVNWTNTTTRATALAYSLGYLVKSGDIDKVYLGTGCTTSVSGQCEDSASRRLIWNYYNRIQKTLVKTDATDSWNYTTATWRSANGSTANRVEVVIGVNEVVVDITVSVYTAQSAAWPRAVGVGLDTTSANSAAIKSKTAIAAANLAWSIYKDMPGIGYHYFQWVEYSVASGTTTWYGDNGEPDFTQSGMIGLTWV